MNFTFLLARGGLKREWYWKKYSPNRNSFPGLKTSEADKFPGFGKEAGKC
jgi:hypothetical protein